MTDEGAGHAFPRAKVSGRKDDPALLERLLEHLSGALFERDGDEVAPVKLSNSFAKIGPEFRIDAGCQSVELPRRALRIDAGKVLTGRGAADAERVEGFAEGAAERGERGGRQNLQREQKGPGREVNDVILCGLSECPALTEASIVGYCRVG
jgi:hypothetical protein